MLPKRKRPVHLPHLRRHNEPVILFVTVCSKDRKPILASAELHQAFVDCWTSSRSYLVGRSVLMPDHIHLFCAPATYACESVSAWCRYWKGTLTRRFPDLKPIWQRDCWDTQLRSGEHYHEKWEYVRLNPVRKELVKRAEDWPFQGELHMLG